MGLRGLAAAVLLLLGSVAYSQTEPRSHWNHSCYTFKDMNRSGVFDMGDRPYAGLAVEVTRPDGTKIWHHSNIDGFANLNASVGNSSAHFQEPGVYKIRAVFPDGFQTLSDTDKQEMEFVARSNAGGGLVPMATCRPIGIAPVLQVTGKLIPQAGVSPNDYLLRAVSIDEQSEFALSLGEGGRFVGIGTPGKWRFEVLNSRSEIVYERDFALEYGAVLFSDVDLTKTVRPETGATYEMLAFDDLLVSNSLFEIPSGYGGLNWLNLISVHNRYYEGGGYVNNTISSEYVAYNSSGVPVPIWSETPFDFKGTYVGVAWPRGEEDEVIFKAWRGQELVYEDRLLLTDNGPVFFDANYEDITKLEFSHGNYERVVLDNFYYKF